MALVLQHHTSHIINNYLGKCRQSITYIYMVHEEVTSISKDPATKERVGVPTAFLSIYLE